MALKAEGEVEREAFARYRERFEAAICNDLNTATALTVLYDVLKDDITDATKRALTESFDEVLSLDLLKELEEDGMAVDPELEQLILAKIEVRTAAKKAKDFARADAFRAELADRGVVIRDTREGVVWELKK